MAKLNLFLDKRRQLKNGLFGLKISVSHKGASAINLNIEIGEDNLKANNEYASGYEIINHPNKKQYNTYINNIFIDYKNKLLNLDSNGILQNLSNTDLRKILKNGIAEDKPDKVLVKDHFTQFIESKNKPRTKSIYVDTYKKLEKFSDLKHLIFEDINYKWVKSFESFLLESNSINTVSIHLRNLRAVFNDAIDEDIISLNSYPFRKFKIKNEPTKKRSLTIYQLREFMNIECELFQKRYIDIFMLTFYLIGINLVDLTHLVKIENGYVEYKRAKTNKLYSIKIEPEALEIIERYKGEKYLLNILDNYSDYKTFTSKINAQLKKIGYVFTDTKGNKITKPLFPYLTTHYARHSWATIAASLDIPKETIAAALGHGGNSVTDIYINFDQKKIDEANRKVIDYLNNHKVEDIH